MHCMQQLGMRFKFVASTLQVRMYCASRPKQPGFSFEALFPDDLFPPGNKAKGEDQILEFYERDFHLYCRILKSANLFNKWIFIFP